MDWFKKHVDTMIILGSVATSMLWMNGKFNEIDKRLTIIETVMMCKGILPSAVAMMEDK